MGVFATGNAKWVTERNNRDDHRFDREFVCMVMLKMNGLNKHRINKLNVRRQKARKIK